MFSKAKTEAERKTIMKEYINNIKKRQQVIRMNQKIIDQSKQMKNKTEK